MDTRNNPLQAEAKRLYQHSMYNDFIVVVEGREFQAHKFVLMAMSRYFEKLIHSDMVESTEGRVVLGADFRAATMSSMLHFMYCGVFSRGEEQDVSLDMLLELAVYLHIPTAMDACCDLIVETELSVENWFEVLSLFYTYNLQRGVTRTKHFLMTNSSELVLTTVEKAETLVQLWEKSEFELFKLLTRRSGFTEEEQGRLLNQLRFGLMTSKELMKVKNSDAYATDNGDPRWQRWVLRALMYAARPVGRRVIYYEGSSDPLQNKVRGREDSLVLYEYDSSVYLMPSELHVCSPDGENWHTREFDLNFSNSTLDFYACYNPGPDIMICVKDFLVVCLHAKVDDFEFVDGDLWAIFDPRSKNWFTMAYATGEFVKENAAVVYHDRSLYLVGGRKRTMVKDEKSGGWYMKYELSDTVARYDFASDTWQLLVTRLPMPLAYNGACSLNGRIYMAGGNKLFRYYASWAYLCELPTSPHLNKGDGNKPALQLQAFDDDRLAYLSEDWNLRLYHTRKSSWSHFTIPYQRHLLGPDPVGDVQLYLSGTVIYVHFVSRKTLCILHRNGSRDFHQVPFKKDEREMNLPLVVLTMPDYHVQPDKQHRFLVDSDDEFY